MLMQPNPVISYTNDTEAEADIFWSIYTKFPIILGSAKLPTKSEYVCVCQSEKTWETKMLSKNKAFHMWILIPKY